MAKLLSNVVNKCIKSGFLGCGNFVGDGGVVFGGV